MLLGKFTADAENTKVTQRKTFSRQTPATAFAVEDSRNRYGRNMQTLIQDIRFGLRNLLKQPAFTLIAVITLALGIGGSTAIFTVVNAALLRGLPYKSPERLYHFWESRPQKEFPQREFSYPDYQDYQQTQVCEGLAAYTGGGAIMGGRGEPERIAAPAASANFFSVLGVEPIIGRTFQPGEDKPGAARVTVLTYGMWQRSFGGDRSVV